VRVWGCSQNGSERTESRRSGYDCCKFLDQSLHKANFALASILSDRRRAGRPLGRPGDGNALVGLLNRFQGHPGRGSDRRFSSVGSVMEAIFFIARSKVIANQSLGQESPPRADGAERTPLRRTLVSGCARSHTDARVKPDYFGEDERKALTSSRSCRRPCCGRSR
jgi:hypothetical protein